MNSYNKDHFVQYILQITRYTQQYVEFCNFVILFNVILFNREEIDNLKQWIAVNIINIVI